LPSTFQSGVIASCSLSDKEWVSIAKVSIVRTPVDIRLLYPPLGMAYITGHLKSLGHEVKQVDLAAEMRLDLRSRLALAECSRTNRVMLKLLFMEEYPVSAEEIHRDLLTPEVRHVSILPSDFSAEEAARTTKQISDVSKDCFNRIKQTKADIIGFNVTWDSTLLSLVVAKNLKRNDKDLRIVFGGPDCSELFRGKLFSHLGYCDAVVTGEGERTVGDLVSIWDKGKGNLRKVKGCMIRENGRVVNNVDPDLIPYLDNLSFPDYEDLTLRNYTAFYALPILTSRGCRYKCTFCVDRSAVWKGTYRERSIENVTREIVHLYEKYGVKTLYFCDSALNPSLKRLDALCSGLAEARKRTGEEILWGGDIRVTPLTKEILQKMGDVGCKYLMFGAESASPRILRSMRKGATKERMAEAFKWAKEAGIWVFTYWMVGYPGEKGDDLLESMEFLVENNENIDEACVAPCEVGYGSDLYQKSRLLGIRFQKSSIRLRKELIGLDKYSNGYKTWVDKSSLNTPMERLYRRTIFEAVARSLGYPSNWAIWPPMPPIDNLDPKDIPIAEKYALSKLETALGQQELRVIPESTNEPRMVTTFQLHALELADGNRSIDDISHIIQERDRREEPIAEILAQCLRSMADMVRAEIVKLNTHQESHTTRNL
jgi:hypothetical protein